MNLFADLSANAKLGRRFTFFLKLDVNKTVYLMEEVSKAYNIETWHVGICD